MNRPIGVLDSGVGALTVSKELLHLLPQEDIVYYGDNGNCPYGNRDKWELLKLVRNMLDFMKSKNVKLVAVACNTTSSIINEYKDDYDFPILSIIEPVVEKVVRDSIKEIGIIGTEFTIKSGTYDALFHTADPSIKVYNEGSKNLAKLIDTGDFSKGTYDEIKFHVDSLVNGHRLNDIILACTHFPILEELFVKANPNVNYMNPAFEQANLARNILKTRNLLNPQKNGSLTIYTSGPRAVYDMLVEKLEIKKPTIHELQKYELAEK